MPRFSPLSCLLMLAIGCGGPASGTGSPTEIQETKLSDVGELYRIASSTLKHPPKTLTDFSSMEPMSPLGYRALISGEIVVFLDAKMADTDEGPAKTSSDEILAYENQVPKAGGQVLLLDRRIKRMTAEEFAAAPKASTKTSEKAKK